MKDLIGSFIFMGLSVFVYIVSDAFALNGENASSLGRNPALYPRILAFLLLALSFVVAFKAVRGGAFKKRTIAMDRQKTKKVALLFFLVCSYVLSIYYLGYVFSSLVFLLLFILVYGGTVKQGMLAGIPITLGLYVVFQTIFKIPLPLGEIIEMWR